METDTERGLPEGMKLPHEAQSHTITPYFKHLSVFNLAQSQIQGKEVYDLKEVVELRFAGDRNYSPVMPVGSMWRKDGNRVITYAERWADQYAAFAQGDEQRASGTALEMLSDYGITPAQLSVCRALKIYSIEALHAMGPDGVKSLGMNANALKDMARRWHEDRERKNATAGEDVTALKAEIERLKASIPESEAAPEEVDKLLAEADDEFQAMEDADLKAFIADRTGSRPKGNPSHGTLVTMARDVAQDAA